MKIKSNELQVKPFFKESASALFFAIFLFIWSIPLYALPTNFVFEKLDLEAGLPALSVHSIHQQSNGFIWFGTTRGASRYDGYEFEHFYYNPGEKNHISNNFVNAIIEDNSGNIWLATEEGLNRIGLDGSVTIFDKSSGLASSWILDSFKDSDGKLWFATGEGVVGFEDKTQSFEQTIIDSLFIGEVIAELPDTKIVAGFGTRLFWINHEQYPAVKEAVELFDFSNIGQFDAEDFITAVTVLNDTTVAIGFEKSGVYVVDLNFNLLQKLDISNGISSNYVTDIIVGPNDYFIVAHYSTGLSIVSTDSLETVSIRSRQFDNLALISDTVRDLLIDDNSNLWVATNQGISRTNIQRQYDHFVALPGEKGLSAKNVLKSIPIDNETLMALTDSGVDIINVKTNGITRRIFNSVEESDFIGRGFWNISREKDFFWVASSIGILRFSLPYETAVPTVFKNEPGNEFNLASSDIYTVLPDPNSNGVWFTGYFNHGLSFFDPSAGVTKSFMNEETDIYQSDGNFTIDKVIGSDGYMWMATTDGVFRVNLETGTYQHIRVSKDRGYIRASDIEEDEEGNFWVTTEGAGLVKISPNAQNDDFALEHFTVEQGLPSNELVSLSIDDDVIWLFSNQQLIRFDRNIKSAKYFPDFFQIPNLNFNLASAYLFEEKLVASSNRGLFLIDRNNLIKSDYQAPISISKVITDSGYSLSSASEINNPLTVGNIDIKFSALDFSNSGFKNYSYRLINYNDDWISTTENSASYGNLPPGQYIFEVKGTNSDGVWSEQKATLAFSVQRPLSDYVVGAMIISVLLLFAAIFVLRRRQIVDLHSQVRIDSLTGLNNRIAFNEQLSESMKTEESMFALAVIDFDRFKDINDIHGHTVGDKFLQEVSRRLSSSIKERDYVARLSGDEFVLIFNRFRSEENILKILSRIMDEIKLEYHIDNLTIRCTASIGVAVYPRDGMTQEELFSHADTAMYHAKKLGKNQIYFFNDELRQQVQRRISIKANLQEALRKDQFELYYQPKINPTTKTVVGCEALIRWIHPEEGLIPPFQFIEESERNGFIIELGAWVIQRACEDYQKLKSKISSLERISVNVSPLQLNKGDFLQVLKSAIDKTGIPPHALEIEITENSLMDESTKTLHLLDEIKKLGVLIALDDFGTGYSSLSYLTKYPIDVLKIDRSIVFSAAEDKSSFTVLHNIFVLAHSLNMQVVTEGIESKEQLNLVKDYSEDLVQGFLFSKPVSMDELFEFYSSYVRMYS